MTANNKQENRKGSGIGCLQPTYAFLFIFSGHPPILTLFSLHFLTSPNRYPPFRVFRHPHVRFLSSIVLVRYLDRLRQSMRTSAAHVQFIRSNRSRSEASSTRELVAHQDLVVTIVGHREETQGGLREGLAEETFRTAGTPLLLTRLRFLGRCVELPRTF